MKGSCLFPVASNTSSMTRRNILSTSMPGCVRCFASRRLTRPHAQAAISFIVRCVLSYHYAFTQRQCLTPDTVWYLATVPFPQAGMPLPGCEALAADCWPAPVFLALADIVVAPNANAVTKIPINSFDVDTRLSSDCFAFSNHLTSALFRGSCLELCPVQRDVFISKHHRSSNISLQSTAETSRHSGCGILPAPRI